MKGDKQTFQVKFWALIGPFICLLSLFVFFVKGNATPSFLPLFLVIGVPLCWRWKLWGAIPCMALMAASLAMYYSSIPLDERFWHLGMGISIGISLFITALSFEEVEALVEAMKLESRSRLENLWKVDEKLQRSEEELKRKKDKIRELNIKIRSYQKLVDRSSEELIELKANHEKFVDELKQGGTRSTQSPDLERELATANEKIMILEKEREESKMRELSEVESALERHLFQFQREKEELDQQHQTELEALQQMVSSLLKEKESLE